MAWFGGGAFEYGSDAMASSNDSTGFYPWYETQLYGFRVASVPEPNSLFILACAPLGFSHGLGKVEGENETPTILYCAIGPTGQLFANREENGWPVGPKKIVASVPRALPWAGRTAGPSARSPVIIPAWFKRGWQPVGPACRAGLCAVSRPAGGTYLTPAPFVTRQRAL